MTDIPIKPSVETIAQRLDSMDKAIGLVQENVNRMPTPAIVMGEVVALREASLARSASNKELFETQIASLKELVETKFQGNQTALDAALKTQKEASDKIEVSFTKQFDGLSKIIETKTGALEDKISDNKERITSSEGHTKGMGQGGVIFLGAISALASIAAIISVVALVLKG